MRGFVFFLFLALIVPILVDGQGCSVCTKTAASLGQEAAGGMNAGILYLAAFPLSIIALVGVIWWRRTKIH